MNLSRFLRFLILVPALALILACEPAGETRTDTRQVALAGAETAEVSIRMGAGELEVGGGAQELMEATFRTNRPSLEPEIDYSVVSKRGILTVHPRRHSRISFGRTVNDWSINLNKETPIDLRVSLGAGESRLDCRGINLDRVRIHMGLGEMTLDLSGPRAKSLNANIEGGMGSATIYLPKEVGVRARVRKGLGSVEAEGLTRSDGVYTNEAYGQSAVTLEISVKAGIGSVCLKER